MNLYWIFFDNSVQEKVWRPQHVSQNVIEAKYKTYDSPCVLTEKQRFILYKEHQLKLYTNTTALLLACLSYNLSSGSKLRPSSYISKMKTEVNTIFHFQTVEFFWFILRIL